MAPSSDSAELVPARHALDRRRRGDPPIRGEGATACTGDALAQAHALLQGLNREMVFDVEMTDIVLSASEAFALKRGVCRDLCHVFIAAARCLGVPARYIAGYLQLADGRIDQEAGRLGGALIPDIGWVGFDPANGVCPTEDRVLSGSIRSARRGCRHALWHRQRNLEVAIKVGQ